MRKLIAYIAVSLSLLCFVGSAGAGDVWRITSLDWQPYSGSDMASQGNSIQELRRLLKTEGIALVVEFYPWARAQQRASQKGYVGYFPAWPEEVKEGFVGSSAIDWSDVSVLTHARTKIVWEGLESVFEHRVGIISSYVYPKQIAELALTYADNIDYTPNEMALLRKLLTGRIDVAITDPSVMLYLADREGVEGIEVLGTVERKELVLAFQDTPENVKRRRVLEKILQQARD